MAIKENKTETLKVRLTKTEYEYLKALSAVTEKSMSELLRRLMVERMPKIIEGLEVGEVKNIVNQITRIGNLQKKVDTDILELIDKNIQMPTQKLLEIKKQQDARRNELLEEVRMLKKVLVEILEEVR